MTDKQKIIMPPLNLNLYSDATKSYVIISFTNSLIYLIVLHNLLSIFVYCSLFSFCIKKVLKWNCVYGSMQACLTSIDILHHLIQFCHFDNVIMTHNFIHLNNFKKNSDICLVHISSPLSKWYIVLINGMASPICLLIIIMQVNWLHGFMQDLRHLTF